MYDPDHYPHDQDVEDRWWPRCAEIVVVGAALVVMALTAALAIAVAALVLS